MLLLRRIYNDIKIWFAMRRQDKDITYSSPKPYITEKIVHK